MHDERPGRGPRAVQAGQDVLDAGAGEPGDADDLAVGDVERQPVDDADTEVPHPDDGVARGGRTVPSGDRGLEAAAHDERDELVRGRVRGVAVRLDPSGAEDRHAVGVLEDLGHVVRHEQRRGAAVGHEVLHDAEEQVRVLLRQEDGRFVEHDECPFVPELGDGPEDRHERLLRVGELLDPGAGVDVHAVPGEQLGCGTVLRAPPDERPVSGDDGRQPQVLGDPERRHEGEVLVDEADADATEVPGRHRERQSGATDLDRRSGVRRVGAGQDLDQGRLAGAVLAEQGVDLARPDLQLDVVERGEPAEPLGESADAEHRCAVRSGPGDRSGCCGAEPCLPGVGHFAAPQIFSYPVL